MLTTLPQLLGLARHLMGKDCRCALVEQIAPLLETLPLAHATCRLLCVRGYGDDAGWSMADPGPDPHNRHREPGWRLEAGGGTGILAHARSGSDRQTGELLTRLSKDTADMEPFMAHDIPDIIVNVSMLVGISAILFSLDPALAALTLIPLPLLAIFVVRFSDRMHEAFTRAREHYGALSALLQDNLSGMKEIQVFSNEVRENRRVRSQAQRHTR